MSSVVSVSAAATRRLMGAVFMLVGCLAFMAVVSAPTWQAAEPGVSRGGFTAVGLALAVLSCLLVALGVFVASRWSAPNMAGSVHKVSTWLTGLVWASSFAVAILTGFGLVTLAVGASAAWASMVTLGMLATGLAACVAATLSWISARPTTRVKS